MKLSEETKVTEEQVELQMTPMIDVVFLLLIFFMCSTKFKTLEGKLEAYLPKDLGPSPPTDNTDPIEDVTISLRMESIKCNGDPESVVKFYFDEWFIEPRVPGSREIMSASFLQTLGLRPGISTDEAIRGLEARRVRTLESKLARLGKHDVSGIPIIVDGAPEVPFRNVISTLNACVRAKFTKISFAAPAQ